MLVCSVLICLVIEVMLIMDWLLFVVWSSGRVLWVRKNVLWVLVLRIRFYLLKLILL